MRKICASTVLMTLVLFLITETSVRSQTANSEGPLGLQWGASADQVRGLDVKLRDAPVKDFGSSFVANNLPRAVSDQETTLLSFGYDDKLWRIAAMSRRFPNDPTGSAVQERYKELSGVLSEKYGRPSSFHRLGGSIYKDAEYFLAGIRGGDSSWFTDFENPHLAVQLKISADDSSTGRWIIFFEDKARRKSFDAARRAREKGAL
jgi:hypothetical protein